MGRPCFSQVSRKVGGIEAKVKIVYGNLLIAFFAEVGPQGQRSLASTYTRDGPRSRAGRLAYRKRCCVEDTYILCETVVKSSWPTTKMNGLLPSDQACVWHQISVNINRQSSSAISVIVKKLLTLARTHINLSSFLFRERDRGMCLNWSCLGTCAVVGAAKRVVQPFSSELFLLWPCTLRIDK